MQDLQIDPEKLPDTVISVTGVTGNGFQKKNKIAHIQLTHIQSKESTIEGPGTAKLLKHSELQHMSEARHSTEKKRIRKPVPHTRHTHK